MKHTRVTNKRFEDGEWWYYGQADGRRRVASHVKKNEKRMFVEGKYVPLSHPLHKPGNYKSFEDAAFSALEGYVKTTEGYVYIITNPAWNGWIKVGMAIDAEDRCKQYQTSSPLRDFELHYSKHFKNRKLGEQKAHEILRKKSETYNGEWFRINLNKAKKLIENIEESK